MTAVSPVFTGGRCFEDEGRPHLLRMEVPLSAQEMVAALYTDRDILRDDELGRDEDVWQHVAIVLVRDGLHTIQAQAAEILASDARNTPPEYRRWLEVCHRRVAEMTGDDPTRGP